MDCVGNTSQNGITEDSPIINIHIQKHRNAFAVPWMKFQEQSNNFVLGCSVNCTYWYNL